MIDPDRIDRDDDLTIDGSDLLAELLANRSPTELPPPEPSDPEVDDLTLGGTDLLAEIMIARQVVGHREPTESAARGIEDADGRWRPQLRRSDQTASRTEQPAPGIGLLQRTIVAVACLIGLGAGAWVWHALDDRADDAVTRQTSPTTPPPDQSSPPDQS